MVSVSQDWVIDSSSGQLADKQPAHWCAAGTALCSDSVMNYWPFNTHSRDSVSEKTERWDEKGRNKIAMRKRGLERATQEQEKRAGEKEE